MEKVLIYMFFLNLLRLNFKLKKIYKNYLEILSKKRNQHFIFTYQDLNPYLLWLNIPKNIQFIIIQNGARFLPNNSDFIKEIYLAISFFNNN